MRVKIDKPLVGQDFGYGDQDIDELFLIPRYTHTILLQKGNYPIAVHVLIHKKGETDLSNFDKFINIAWASLYDSDS